MITSVARLLPRGRLKAAMGGILGVFVAGRQMQLQTQYPVPLPKEIHKVLDSDVIANKQVLIVGDVHGCCDELQELLTKANYNAKDVIVIFAGDLINKGPKSLETLKLVREMGTSAYSVRGNHEDRVLYEWFEGQKSPFPYSKKYQWVEQLTVDDIGFITELPYSISIPSLNTIIVHGGILPSLPLCKQQPVDMVTMRNVVLQDDGSYKALEDRDEGEAWASIWKGPQHIYFGHDARRGLQIHPFATGLDTGCLYGKELTGIFISGSRKMISVNAKMPYKKPKQVTEEE